MINLPQNRLQKIDIKGGLAPFNMFCIKVKSTFLTPFWYIKSIY